MMSGEIAINCQDTCIALQTLCWFEMEYNMDAKISIFLFAEHTINAFEHEWCMHRITRPGQFERRLVIYRSKCLDIFLSHIISLIVQRSTWKWMALIGSAAIKLEREHAFASSDTWTNFNSQLMIQFYANCLIIL